MTMETGAFAQALNVLQALQALARWQVGRGNATDSPFRHLVIEDAPAELQGRLVELRTLTYADLLQFHEAPQPQAAGIAAHMELLSPRERALLLERILPDRPTTLQTLGQRWGVSHQRVAQLEREFRVRIGTLCAPNTAVGRLLVELRDAAAPLAPLTQLFERFPRLADLVPGSDIPVWRLVARVADDLEIDDGWVAVPSFDSNIRTLRHIARELEVFPGVSFAMSRQALWDLPPDLLGDWARRCGLVAVQNYLVDPASNVADALEQALMVTSAPQTADDLGDLLRSMGAPRSPGTVAAALRDDHRFVRRHGRWDLVRRPSTFATAQQAVQDVVSSRGPTHLGEVLDLADDLGLPVASLEYHATHGPFAAVQGRVVFRPVPEPTTFPPAEAVHLFRLGGGWGYLATLTAHAIERRTLQISGSIPVLFGMEHPSHRDLPAMAGLRITWENGAASISLPDSVLRRFQVGDRLFVWLGFGSVEFRLAEPVDATLTGYAAALNSFGLPASGDPVEDAAAVAAALDISTGTDLPRLIDACRRKREWTALAALSALAERG